MYRALSWFIDCPKDSSIDWNSVEVHTAYIGQLIEFCFVKYIYLNPKWIEISSDTVYIQIKRDMP
jgi:hypothetical protein